MSATRSARQRARAEITREITDTARRQLATAGAAGVSLRAVARELGMVSSAVYRYFASRDELLTALVVDAYNAVGDCAEAAAADPDSAPIDRWTAVWTAVRGWGLDHRHEYALVYGTPVPGYSAPDLTKDAAVRTPATLLRIVTETAAAGRLGPVTGPLVAHDAITDEVWKLVDTALEPPVAAALLAAWSQMIGMISFELFGHFTGVVAEPDRFYRATARATGHRIGLPDD